MIICEEYFIDNFDREEAHIMEVESERELQPKGVVRLEMSNG